MVIVEIAEVRNNYADISSTTGKIRRVMTTFTFELVVTNRDDYTFEQACDDFKAGTRFQLIPVE